MLFVETSPRNQRARSTSCKLNEIHGVSRFRSRAEARANRGCRWRKSSSRQQRCSFAWAQYSKFTWYSLQSFTMSFTTIQNISGDNHRIMAVWVICRTCLSYYKAVYFRTNATSGWTFNLVNGGEMLNFLRTSRWFIFRTDGTELTMLWLGFDRERRGSEIRSEFVLLVGSTSKSEESLLRAYIRHV